MAHPSKMEKDGVERFEAPDTSRVAEADGRGRAELEGSCRGNEVGCGGERQTGVVG